MLCGPKWAEAGQRWSPTRASPEWHNVRVTSEVRRLSAHQIERKAFLFYCESLLKLRSIAVRNERDGDMPSPLAKPAVPVDEILEHVLGLTLEFADLHQMLKLEGPRPADGPAVLGMTLIRQRRVIIDESLDPVLHPKMEGRCNFTIAHEIGHYKLHPHTANLLDTHLAPARPSNSGRSSAKPLPEWQADKFASYLLMPKSLILKEWHKRFGHDQAIEISELAIINLGSVEAAVDWIGESEVEDFAEDFKVSKQAMRIRLRELRLLPSP